MIQIESWFFNAVVLVAVIVFVLGAVAVAVLGILVHRQQRQLKNQQKRIEQLKADLQKQTAFVQTAKNMPPVKQEEKETTVRNEEVRAESPTPERARKTVPVQREEKNIPGLESPLVNSDLVLTDEFKQGLELMNGNTPCIFITGKAGTGKSRLLNYFVENTKKKVALLAFTGMAAVKINGQTINSFFSFPAKTLTDEDIKPSSKRELYRALDMIVIDEISMVRVDMLDAIDQFLRLNGKDRTKPFGGAQMVFFGDLYQLPPVIGDEDESKYLASNYDGKFFFDAHVMKEIHLEKLELTKVFRQKDENFITALNAVRVNDMDQEILDYINERHAPVRSKDRNEFVTLVTTNQTADMINSQELGRIAQPSFMYRAKLEGEYTKKEWKKRLPADLELNLKVGAQVIFIKNDIEKRWYNGSRGKIIELGENHIIAEVHADDGKFEYEIQRETWEIRRYRFEAFKLRSDIVGTFVQYPLRLGWAITIHKSQGATLERVHIDMGAGAFDAGQAYVALSRCKSLEGLTLERPLTFADVKSNDAVVRFMKSAFPVAEKKAAQPIQVFKHAAPHTPDKKDQKVRRPLAGKWEEELKYGSNGNDKQNWFADETVGMVLPILFKRDAGVDLRTYRGSLKVYVNNVYQWTSTISDEKSMQSAWQATRGIYYVSVQPLNDFDEVKIKT